MDLIRRFDLINILDTYEATFSRAGSDSQIDAYLVPRRLVTADMKMEILDYDISDHKAIILSLMIEVPEQPIAMIERLKVNRLRIERVKNK